MIDNKATPGKLQDPDSYAQIRTRGLTLLAQILAASMISKDIKGQESGIDKNTSSIGNNETDLDINDDVDDAR